MLAEVRGQVLAVRLDGAVVAVGGLGLMVRATPRTLAGLRVGATARLATSLVVREDSLTLFGFETDDERDVFELVPPMLKESAYGLGSTTWEVVWRVVLPFTKVGVIGGIMLGLGRALGETMAVTFVIGNAHRLSPSLFAPGNSIASALANEFTEATSEIYLQSLVQLGLVLFLVTFVINALARLLVWSVTRGQGREARV